MHIVHNLSEISSNCLNSNNSLITSTSAHLFGPKGTIYMEVIFTE